MKKNTKEWIAAFVVVFMAFTAGIWIGTTIINSEIKILKADVAALMEAVPQAKYIGEYCFDPYVGWWVKFSSKDITESVGDYFKIYGIWRHKDNVFFYNQVTDQYQAKRNEIKENQYQWHYDKNAMKWDASKNFINEKEAK